MTTPTYSELRFAPPGQSAVGHTFYWHRTPVDGVDCETCMINYVVKPTLMEIVQDINPGAPELPEWVYNGAIMGVRGGTEARLGYLYEGRKKIQAREHFSYSRDLFSG